MSESIKIHIQEVVVSASCIDLLRGNSRMVRGRRHHRRRLLLGFNCFSFLQLYKSSVTTTRCHQTSLVRSLESCNVHLRVFWDDTEVGYRPLLPTPCLRSSLSRCFYSESTSCQMDTPSNLNTQGRQTRLCWVSMCEKRLKLSRDHPGWDYAV